MFTKSPKVFKHGKQAPSVTPAAGKNGLGILKDASAKVSKLQKTRKI
jgi:hypothetical protein